MPRHWSTIPSTEPEPDEPEEPAPDEPAPAEVPPADVPEGDCHPSYAGACVPIASDVDCGGGQGNGPAYVYEENIQVIGPDVYDLDGSDNDGIACEPPRS